MKKRGHYCKVVEIIQKTAFVVKETDERQAGRRAGLSGGTV